MRRLARHLFTFCAVASLLLCGAVCVLWARSCSGSDHLVWWSPSGYRMVGTATAHFTMQLNPGDTTGRSTRVHNVEYLRMSTWAAPTGAQAYSYLSPAVRFSTWEFAGIRLYSAHGRNGMSAVTGTIPCWIVAAATAVLPLYWTALRLRSYQRGRERRSAGLCQACGYDLRATPQRCPECGRVGEELI